MLDIRLQQTQARETGICPIRRDLYTQCFGNVFSANVSRTDLKFVFFFFFR